MRQIEAAWAEHFVDEPIINNEIIHVSNRNLLSFIITQDRKRLLEERQIGKPSPLPTDYEDTNNVILCMFAEK